MPYITWTKAIIIILWVSAGQNLFTCFVFIFIFFVVAGKLMWTPIECEICATVRRRFSPRPWFRAAFIFWANAHIVLIYCVDMWVCARCSCWELYLYVHCECRFQFLFVQPRVCKICEQCSIFISIAPPWCIVTRIYSPPLIAPTSMSMHIDYRQNRATNSLETKMFRIW